MTRDDVEVMPTSTMALTTTAIDTSDIVPIAAMTSAIDNSLCCFTSWYHALRTVTTPGALVLVVLVELLVVPALKLTCSMAHWQSLLRFELGCDNDTFTVLQPLRRPNLTFLSLQRKLLNDKSLIP